MSAPAIHIAAITPETNQNLATPTPTIATPSPVATTPIREENENEDPPIAQVRSPSPKPTQKPAAEQKTGFFSKLFKKNTQQPATAQVQAGKLSCKVSILS